MTPNKENIEAILCAYVDGDIDAAGRAEIEKHLAENPQHRQILAEMITMRQWVRNLPRATPPTELADALTGQLERSVLLGQGAAASPAIASAVNRRSQWMAIAAVIFLTAGLGIAVWVILIPTSGRPRYAVAPSNPNNDIVIAQPDAATTQPDAAIGDAAVDRVAPPAPLVMPVPAPDVLAMRAAAGPLDISRTGANGDASPSLGIPAPESAPIGPESPDQPPSIVRQRLAQAGVFDSADSDHRMVVLVNAADPSAASAQVEQVLNDQKIAYSNSGSADSAFAAAIPGTMPSGQLAMDNTNVNNSLGANGGMSIARDGSVIPDQRFMSASNVASASDQISAQASGGNGAAPAASPGPATTSPSFTFDAPGTAANQAEQQAMAAPQNKSLAAATTMPGNDQFGSGAAAQPPSQENAVAIAPPQSPPAGGLGGYAGSSGGGGGFGGAGGGFGGADGGLGGASGGFGGGRGGRGGAASAAPQAARMRGVRRLDAAATTSTADLSRGVFVVRNLNPGQVHRLQSSLATRGGLDLHVYGPASLQAKAQIAGATQPAPDAGDTAQNGPRFVGEPAQGSVAGGIAPSSGLAGQSQPISSAAAAATSPAPVADLGQTPATLPSDQLAPATRPSDDEGLLVLIVVQEVPVTTPAPAPASPSPPGQ